MNDRMNMQMNNRRPFSQMFQLERRLLRPEGDYEGARLPLVRKQDLRYVEQWSERIDEFLDFSPQTPMAHSLQRAFEAWREIPALRVENDEADIALSCFQRSGGIRACLRDMATALDSFDASEDPAMLSALCYNNYLYFLKAYIAEMVDKTAEAAARPRPAVPTAEPKSRLAFIRDECGGQPTIVDVPKAVEALGRLRETLHVGEVKTPEQARDIRSVSECVQLLLQYSPSINQEAEVFAKSLEDKVKAMRANIARGRAMYGLLTDYFSDDWFELFKPGAEGNRVDGRTTDELKQLYTQELEALNERLSALQEYI